MQLPNKLYSYQRSTLALLPPILRILDQGEIHVHELFMQTRSHLVDSTDFLSAMDCLYVLRAIDMTDEGMVHRAH